MVHVSCGRRWRQSRCRSFRGVRFSRSCLFYRGFRELALVLAAFAGFWATGCAGPKLPQIMNTAEFNEKVLANQRPVLVEFYKHGCATCVVIEPKLGRMAQDYEGRADFAKFELMTSYFAVTSPEIRDRYDIHYFPTVILFVEGQPRNRWVLDYDMNKYRAALDEVVGVFENEPSASP